MEVDRSFGSTTRKRTFLGLLLLIFGAFTARLVQLQLIEGSEYRTRTEAQGIKQIVREPIRGAIYDRYGHPIVANIPSYTVLVTPNKLTAQSKALLARILATDTITINDKIKQYKTNDYSPIRIWRDVDRQGWARLNELHTDLVGVDIVEESKRAYTADIRASHILGYTKEISNTEIGELGDYYTPGDVVGKSGIEKAFEDHLRGEKGYEFVAVNNRGQRVNSFNDGKNDRTPSNGFDLYLGLDAGLQQYAEKLLKGYHGAVVALDPNNGEILAMASAPDYDPALFSGVTTKEAYEKVANDPGKPLLNRATQAVYPPGSTWKMLMAIAGLTEGYIKPSTTISCPGSFTLGGNTWKCHGAHGLVNVRKAIHVSCNVFFYKLALQMGIENYTKYGQLFHFGRRLGVDVPEGATLLPSQEYYDKVYGAGKWPKGVLVNLGIGQGEIKVNPMQLAAYCGALANGGTWYQPHLVRAIKNNQLGSIEKVKYDAEDLGISHDIMDVIHAGMFDVVNTPGGTAGGARMSDILIAGKTGTAQAGKGKRDHAWFICYAPFDKPKIAMCVLVENSGFGGTYSAPIARKLIRYYLTRQREEGDSQPGDSLTNPNALRSINMPPGADGDEQESSMIPDSLH
ncbi:MAG TPA: penicillin-binding protein 2 [Candidatus Kapabacteria bacterium]|nr:penicillin-binding protein 2 [Candidatus Kapabacteria bacterium]